MDARDRFGWQYCNLTIANLTNGAPLTLKTAAGTLHTITVNLIPSSAGTLSVYDSATAAGTLVASVTHEASAANKVQRLSTLIFDCQLTTGLTVAVSFQCAYFNYTITYI